MTQKGRTNKEKKKERVLSGSIETSATRYTDIYNARSILS